MKLKSLLEKLAKKAGIDIASDEFKAITIPDVEVPDDTAANLERGLMNLDGAKNHPDIRKHIRTETLNGVDKKVTDILEEYGIAADDVKNETNSFEKIPKLVKAIAVAEAAKAKSKTTVDKDGYDKQIQELTAKMKTLTEGHTADKAAWDATRENDLTDFELQSILSGKNYDLPKTMGSKLKIQTAKAAVMEQLQNLGFKIKRSENGTIQIIDKEGKPALDLKTNELVDTAKFIDGALAQNSLLKVNDPADPGKDNNHQQTLGGDHQQKIPASFQNGISALDKMIADQTAQV